MDRRKKTMENSLKERLKKGETLLGSFVTLKSTDVAEILSLVGFDYLWIETEHAPLDFSHVQTLIQAVGGRCPCLVRIPENKEVWIRKALDTGCDGIVVPQVMTAEEAREAVQWSLYPPLGNRRVGISRAHSYGMAFRDYVDRVNEHLTIVVQVENAEAVKNIESIAAVPGIGAIFIGPFDLSGSLGVLGQISHPQVQGAIEEVRECCRKAGVPLGIFAADAQNAKTYINKGFGLIALGMDTFYLWKSTQAMLKEVRE
jgi:2-dehydro-3-deoxyglucarate aldolase/4-hydroxy-2-oxoheptanedioate aldolase